MFGCRVASNASHFAAFAASDGFDDMIEPAVVDAGVRWVDERKVALPKTSCRVICIGDLSAPQALGELAG